MGTEPIVSTDMGIILCLTAAMLWGSWSASLKHLCSYPLDGFLILLYTSSFVFVWTSALIVERGELLSVLSSSISNDPVRALGILCGGAAFAIGMGVTLVVLSRIGLSIAQPIQSSVSIMLGTSITMVVGGVPAGTSPAKIVFAATMFICAVGATMMAASLRLRSWTTIDGPPPDRHTMTAIWQCLPLVMLSSVLTTAYPWALSLGLESPTQLDGLSLFPFMGLLVTGALVGTLVMSGSRLRRNRQWNQALTPSRLVVRLGIVSGIFHFGGNIIHSIGTTALSASIAWPLGLSAALWTILWGLGQGEFRRAPRIAYCVLVLAIALYCVGVSIVIDTV